MKALGSPASVCDAIRADAQAELDRIARELARDLAAIGDARDDGDPVPDRERRLEVARRAARERIAAEDQADRRDALEARERWLRAAAEDGARRLAEERAPELVRARLLGLAGEALRELASARGGRLPEGAELLVAPRDLPFLDAEWTDEAAAEAGLPSNAVVLAASEAIAGGCVARTRDGRLSFDNTWAARARRLEPAWRAELSALFPR